MKSERTNLQKAARIISILGHPFVLLPATVLIASLQSMSAARALTTAIITVLVTVLPLLFIIRRKVVSGRWSDHDISVSSERRGFYPIAIGVVSISCVFLWLLGLPHSLLIGMMISLALLIAAMLINGWSKISLHLIFATYCAVSLLAVSYLVGAGFILLAVSVAWSRVVLERHSLPQVLSGMLLGMAAGIFLLRVINFL
jgi:membrane-associated phospholipid phosphatase